jgi:hypothetical protein
MLHSERHHTTMKINEPLIITSRLLPGFRLGGAEVSIGYYGCVGTDRVLYYYAIDIGDVHHEAHDLSGIGGLQRGLECLVSFLGACAEGYRHEMSTGIPSENADLFPPAIAEWAYQNDGELFCLGLDLLVENLIEE